MTVVEVLERILTVGLERPKGLGKACKDHDRYRYAGRVCPDCRRERIAILIGFGIVLLAMALLS